MNRRKVIIFIPFFFLPFSCFAWGMLGHRIVGEIADKYLTLKARAEIKKNLGDESIAMATNWADFIKSDSNFKYLNNWHYVNLDSGLTAKQAHMRQIGRAHV